MALPNEYKIIIIPENILLEIFRYLPVKDRCIAGRVCKQWRRIVKDNSLWRHVNLLEYRLDLSKMWKVLRGHFSPCLLTMRIRGFVHTGCSKRRKASVSDAMLTELSIRCPNLWLLHLDDCNTDGLTLGCLPPTITDLSITKSTWRPRWLRDRNDKFLPNLKALNLSSTVRVDNFDLEDISQWTDLNSLCLNGCYRISDVEVIAKNLVQLELLDLSGTWIDELGIHHISRHLKKLKKLYVAECKDVNDSCLATIASGLPGLELLDISFCENISLDGVKSLSGLYQLTCLAMRRKEKFNAEDVRKCFSHDLKIET